MSIEAINEALELLHITQNNMGPDREWLPSEEQAHWDRVSKCMEGLEKLRQQEPLVALCAAPVPAAVPEGWRTLVSDVLAYFDTPVHDFSAEQEQRLIARLQTMLSAAPAAPAVPADVAKDAERYRWLRDRLAIEDIDRLVSEFFGTPDEAEIVKTDAAIDAAMQKGDA